MRYAVLLLSGLLMSGTFAVAQSAPAASTGNAGASQTAPAEALPAAPPLHPITEAQAREMLKLTGADRLRKQAMTQMLGYMKSAFPPYMPEDVMTDLQKSLEAVDMDTITVKIYQEHLSEKDAAAIIAFYKTSAGQHLLSSMPEIVKEAQEAGAKAGEQVAREVIERHKAEIKAAAKKYTERQKELHSLSSQPQN